MRVTVEPTLETMRDIYRLPRDGGPASARFRAYLAKVERFGFPAYNPMAGPKAAATVDHLLACDAERVAREAAQGVVDAVPRSGPLRLAVVVASPGMWTDRLATEVLSRTMASRRPGEGILVCWSGEEIPADGIRALARAETVRVLWSDLHGDAATLADVLGREGLAEAMGGGPPPATEAHALHGIERILVAHLASSAPGIMGAGLAGDAAAEAMGWTPLGIPRWGGLHAARARAQGRLDAEGLPAALALRGW